VLTRCLMAPGMADDVVQSERPILDEWSRLEPLPRWAGLNVTVWADPVMLYAGQYDVWVSKASLDEEGAFSIRIHPM
jgi:hypothetical protein